MRRLTLALLLVTPLVIRAEDPPFLTAARERQAKAKAFEAIFTLTYEWKQHKPFGVEGPPRDYTEIGSAKLLVDGSNYRLEMDQPAMTALGPVKRRRVYTRNSESTRVIFETPIVRGPHAGEFTRACAIFHQLDDTRWPDPFIPIYWAMRGGDSGLLLSEHRVPPEPGVTDMVRATGRRECIGGRDCVEYEWTRPYHAGKSPKRFMWFDEEADFVPRRVDRVEVDYTPHPVCGWVPTRWTTPTQSQYGAVGTVSVNVDSFELRDSLPPDLFTLAFPPGSTVSEQRGNQSNEFKVSEDGSLVPVPRKPEPTPLQAELPSLHESLWVVGVAVAVFVGFVVLLKWVARSRTDDSANSAGSRDTPG